MSRVEREWLIWWANELHDVGWVRREPMLVELSAVEAIDEQTDRTIECIGTTRETARFSSQAGQVMTQLCIASLDREGICLALRNLVSAEMIPKTIIGIKSIAVIDFGLRSIIHHILNSLLGAFPDHTPAEKTASSPVYERDDVDPLFLSPIKVNNSSISASLISSGMGTASKFSACAATQSETVR